jgi:hypothetical protein
VVLARRIFLDARPPVDFRHGKRERTAAPMTARLVRWLTALPFILLVTTGAAAAQGSDDAPLPGPVVLLLPPSARTAALGQAWVAGRDHDVIFYNPAQLVGNSTGGIDLSLIRYGPSSTLKSIASTYAGGRWSFTLGWGVQLVDFDRGSSSYPRDVSVLLADAPSTGTSSLLAVGGAVVVKGFRAGASGKYVSEPGRHALLADVGVARNQLGGVLAFSLQNLGGGSADDDEADADVPTQYSYGYSVTRPVKAIDLGLFAQMTHRSGWASPAGGLEIGYSWIEGYTVALRAGIRRPERDVQRPMTLGAAVTGDRLTLEYAVQFFEGGRTANGVTIRWR